MKIADRDNCGFGRLTDFARPEPVAKHRRPAVVVMALEEYEQLTALELTKALAFDLVYTKSPLKKNPYGIIKENKGKPGIVSTLYPPQAAG